MLLIDSFAAALNYTLIIILIIIIMWPNKNNNATANNNTLHHDHLILEAIQRQRELPLSVLPTSFPGVEPLLLLQQQPEQQHALNDHLYNLILLRQRQAALMGTAAPALPPGFLGATGQGHPLRPLVALGKQQECPPLAASSLAAASPLTALSHLDLSLSSSSARPPASLLQAADLLLQKQQQVHPEKLGISGAAGGGMNSEPILSKTSTISKSPAPKKKEQETEEAVNPLHLKKQTFPEKVYLMLTELSGETTKNNNSNNTTSNHEFDQAISFVAQGTAFQIHDARIFETEIMPLYFSSTRMSSFQRQLNIYGFERIERGPYRGAYRHESFCRGKPELLNKIRRTRASRNQAPSSAAASSKSKSLETTKLDNKQAGENTAAEA